MSKKQTDIDFKQETGPLDDPNWDAPEQLPTLAHKNFFGDGADDMEGEWDQQDVGIPRMTLIHAMDKRALDGVFRPGNFVYNNESVLEAPFPLVVIRSKKGYLQKLTQQERSSGAIPMLVWTAAEVRERNGSFDYPTPPGMIGFQDFADLFVLIGQQESETFPFEHVGYKWAPALYRAKGTAYTRVVRQLGSARALTLRDGTINGLWDMSVMKETVNNNPVFVPVFKFVRRNLPEFVTWLKDLIKGFGE